MPTPDHPMEPTPPRCAHRRVRLHMKPARRLLRQDCEAVLLTNAESFPGVAQLDETEFERLLILSNCHIAIDAADGTMAGYALVIPDHAPYDGEEFGVLLRTSRRPFLYIDQVAVRAKDRRTGIASALYSAIESDARSTKMSGLCCEVNLSPPNPTSIAFHRSLGFEDLGVLETMDQRTVQLMRKTTE